MPILDPGKTETTILSEIICGSTSSIQESLHTCWQLNTKAAVGNGCAAGTGAARRGDRGRRRLRGAGGVNHRWLGRYARLHPSFSVEPALLERNSLWMNAYFQKIRMTTSAASPQAKSLIKKHRETVMERLRSAPLPHSESPFPRAL
ncbi:hypothetical protein GQ600_8275 [Phytophthora cactorum]|nr:hypothetical protein GQ600_8275 [Phytophthora cactorum]